MSVASGQTDERLPSTILGWDGRYKYRPDGWLPSPHHGDG